MYFNRSTLPERNFYVKRPKNRYDYDRRRFPFPRSGSVKTNFLPMVLGALMAGMLALGAIGLPVWMAFKSDGVKICTQVNYQVSLKLTNLDYIADFGNDESTAFNDFAHHFCTSLSHGIGQDRSWTRCIHPYNPCYVTSLTETTDGHTQVNFDLKMVAANVESKYTTTTAKAEAVKVTKERLLDAINLGKKGSDYGNYFRIYEVSGLTVNFLSATQNIHQCNFVPLNAHMSMHHGTIFNNLFGYDLSLECHEHHRISPGTTIAHFQCLSTTNEWNTTIPTCGEITCSNITQPTGSTVVPGILNQNAIGRSLVFLCQYGFSFTNDTLYDLVSVITCQDDGTWDLPGGVPSECHSQYCPIERPEDAEWFSGPLSTMLLGNSLTYIIHTHYHSLLEIGIVRTYTCMGGGTGNVIFNSPYNFSIPEVTPAP